MSDVFTSGAQSSGNSNGSWPVERSASSDPSGWRPTVPRRDSSASSRSSSSTDADDLDLDPTNFPAGKRSLAGISLRASLLGVSLGLTSSLCLLLATVFPTPLWRVPFFIAALSLFHFLEFYVTARYNTRAATVSAFLLSSNGWAYNVAHGSAVVECLVSQLLWPEGSTIGHWFSVPEPFYGTSISALVLLGFTLTVVGQVVRTLAMSQAASNFNHHVQVEHKAGHVLVKHGVYRYFRHPSYFGFFWWGLGTQLVLGNVVCFIGYAVVLWRFFASRIKREESFLIQFFGAEYVQYRQDTPIGIPFIR
ncbi:hypothetical protein N7492_009145 [Penicillium capsulatum]|uniref:Protein-S-isoprenylcysteine O-methyltransferase n=1 Tax=Penicillium capsulatum TaxID=69766 RepID=A0A9W9LHT1_9EURO|nr:hypothetical protein N7492_009145 [Penicillium capsulatum]KAJ6106544.1 hypothetical protein N7512_010061 [Penicillium capsulatum]